jgi:hypothetical protein
MSSPCRLAGIEETTLADEDIMKGHSLYFFANEKSPLLVNKKTSLVGIDNVVDKNGANLVDIKKNRRK